MKTKAAPVLDIPGIDDADHLYSICSRDGQRSAYIRIHEQADQSYAYGITLDDDAGHFCDDKGEEGGFATVRDALFAAWPGAVELFTGHGLPFVYDNDMRRLAPAYRKHARAN